MKIFFHIGMPKTASSFLQRRLWINRSALLELGYYYGPRTIDHCPEITNRVYQNVNAVQDIRDFMASQLSSASEAGAHSLIISSECLFLRRQEIIEAICDKNLPTQAILYWRRQDLFLESAWQQWHYKDLSYHDFDHFVESFHQPKSWEKHAAIWDQNTSEPLSISFYDCDALKERGIFPDLLQKLGVREVSALDFELRPTDKWGDNRSFDNTGMDLLFRLRNLSNNDIHEHRVQNIIYELFGDTITRQKAVLLNKEKRESLLKQYAPTNKKVAQLYNIKEPFSQPDNSDLPSIDYIELVENLVARALEK